MIDYFFFKLFIWSFSIIAFTVTVVVCVILYSASKVLKRISAAEQAEIDW